MGARGNSGVILSQMFRGIAKGAWKARTEASVEELKSMVQGPNFAYKAVMKTYWGNYT